MRDREIDRRRERERGQASPSALGREHPILALQRAIGNHAVAQVLARKPAAAGPKDSIQIHGVGDIKVTGGNLDEWTGKETPNTVEVTSHKGKHSAKLEKLANEATKHEVKVTIAAETKVGDELNVGGGTVLEIKDARVKGYALEGGVETWHLGDFTNVHRIKVTHRVA